MENLNVKTKNIESPFMFYCQKVIPLAFDESLSYYEVLCYLTDYIKNTVTTAINTNSEAITELQNAYTLLKDYVDNYFDNLDIQTEINNKLDDMAESGELAEIIAQYIQLQGVLAYNTVSDMKNASNLVNGSFAKTYGKTTLNDGDGAFYKIRTITSGDVVDEVNIIALTNYPTLIAELIIDNNIINLNNKIGTLSNLDTTYKTDLVGAINEVNSKTETPLTEIVIFGDSWSDPTSLDAIWGTNNYIGKELNLNVNNYAKSGAYMSGTGTDDLQGQVSTFNSDSNINKTKVKYIVILGGINDYRNSVTWTNLYTKLEEQIELLKTYCPQAKILFVSNCQWYYDETQGNYWCGIHEEIRATEKIVTYNIFGTLGKEVYNTNNYFHLTQTGQKIMLSNIVASLTGGEIQYFEDTVSVTNSDGTINYSTQRVGNMVLLNIKLTPTNSKTFYSFANPSGYYYNYYTHRFGVVGRAKEVGIINIGYNAIAFDFNTALTVNEEYIFTLTIPLNHN